MKIIGTPLEGIKHLSLKNYLDDRGSFCELYQLPRFLSVGLTTAFVQDNVSVSKKGVLRGLHFHNPSPQAKLITVLEGQVFDVAVDLRIESYTFGKWCGFFLSSPEDQIYIPEGFAHGFLTLSDKAIFHYKCSAVYNPEGDKTLRWDDPDLSIEWPTDYSPILSKKDCEGLAFKGLGQFVFES